MKNIFLLILIFAGAQFTFAQQVAKVNSLEKYNKEKFSDVFTFELTEKVSKEKVLETAKYYTKYFSASFDERSNTVTLKMNSQDWQNRHIMRRFFAGMGIEEVNMEGTPVKTDDFFKEYVLTTDQQPK